MQLSYIEDAEKHFSEYGTQSYLPFNQLLKNQLLFDTEQQLGPHQAEALR